MQAEWQKNTGNIISSTKRRISDLAAEHANEIDFYYHQISENTLIHLDKFILVLCCSQLMTFCNKTPKALFYKWRLTVHSLH